MRTRRTTIEDLRRAIECLPKATKIAMLEGIRANEIIVGAYTNGHGVCPMLAAHRAGGRTSLISFARAWDRFAFANTRKAVRPATERELRVLASHLEASLLEDLAPASDLAAAITEHRQLLARRVARAKSRPYPSGPAPCPDQTRSRPRRRLQAAGGRVRRARAAILAM